jgi:thermostable 8-oxoguanine DNA glycosylase
VLTLLDKRKQAKLQWLQNPSQINRDTLNNIRPESKRTFRNKKGEYVIEKRKSLEQRVIIKISDTYIEA